MRSQRIHPWRLQLRERMANARATPLSQCKEEDGESTCSPPCEQREDRKAGPKTPLETCPTRCNVRQVGGRGRQSTTTSPEPQPAQPSANGCGSIMHRCLSSLTQTLAKCNDAGLTAWHKTPPHKFVYGSNYCFHQPGPPMPYEDIIY